MADDTIPGDKGTSAAAFPVAGAVVNPDKGDADDEPMTDVQAAELRQLTDEKGEAMDANLTRRQAQDRIDALKSEG